MTKHKKRSTKFALASPSMDNDVSMGARVEKIANGFLSHVHHSSGDSYKRATTFHRTDPTKGGGQIARIMANLKKMHGTKKSDLM